MICRCRVDLTYQRKQAFNEPSAAGVHVIEAWKNDTVPDQNECALSGLGKWTGAECGDQMPRDMRIASITK
ncbi:hypothetical protein GCM10007857_85880 [Bradyrhizobium iriomotense]|uniref:Uncharacterized protein n=1 Tax=Bradyrhizobium iriomotense TaxID=441950 RepID=A0ABQ6BG07_9BRAD|nr:hypothetical protein GCM10007857_85880 [Bradyrhizobium iriomotense]